ncbi:MAG: DsbE family thiol:disulfide interchange protein [Rhodospirillales bacterium]|nr:DsbE family thiol:disulfide interchange protein [Rhodospirillales bacterium]
MKRALFFLPLVLFAVLALYLGFGLTRDPQHVPSALIDRPVPAFDLPAVAGVERPGLSSAMLAREVSLVNVFASWCPPCRIEHPILMRMSREGDVPIYGINYKDKAPDAARWLAELGNPYRAIGWDFENRVAVDWGVYGAPETFVVDRHGKIRHRHVGAITPDVLDRTLMPLVKRLRSEP